MIRRDGALRLPGGEILEEAIVEALVPPIRRLTRAEVFSHSHLALDLKRIHSHPSTGVHTHEFSELVVVLRGTGIHVTPGGEYPIGAGDAFVLHGDEAHGYMNTEDLDLVNILFSLEELGLPRADISALPGFHVLFTLEPKYRRRDRFESRLRLSPEKLHHVAGLIDGLEKELVRRDPGWAFAATAYFMLIVSDLSRFYSHAEEPAVQPLLRLGRVVSHMERHFADAVSLDDLARVGCLSRRTLTRVFRNAFGCSPIEYLTRLRINHAMALLQDADLSITEIAFQVGFRDSNHFSRRFRAITGTSPREFRRSATLPH